MSINSFRGFNLAHGPDTNLRLACTQDIWNVLLACYFSTQSSNAARVRRFRQEDYDEDKDDDKKKSTYNGNSTQQQ